MQTGFLFEDETPVYNAHPVGTWTVKKLSTQEYLEIFENAKNKLNSLSGMMHKYFSHALFNTIETHKEYLEWNKNSLHDFYHLWHENLEFSEQEIKQFIAHCSLMKLGNFEDAEFKVVEEKNHIRAGMYLEGIGSITVIIWSTIANNFRSDFSVHRDSFFLESYRESIESIYAPVTLWDRAYSAQIIAEAKGVPSVRTFVLNGRDFVNIGATFRGDWSDCKAYSLCPLTSWRGRTFNRRELVDAYNDGSVERGDSRGLIVSVRGVLCVLEKEYKVFDDKTVYDFSATAYEEEEEPNNEDEDEEELDEEFI